MKKVDTLADRIINSIDPSDELLLEFDAASQPNMFDKTWVCIVVVCFLGACLSFAGFAILYTAAYLWAAL